MHARLRRLHRIMLVVDRGSGTGEIVNLIDLQIERKGHVVPDQFEVRMTNQVLDVTSRSGEEIVDAEDASPIRQQALTQVRTQETRTAGNQYARF
jgi:hypothetical protein